jgi:quinol monooxygenase YgiN
MPVIAGRIRIDAAKRDAATTAALEVMEATRREPGCISYTFSADLADDGLFHVFEEWESQEALDLHFRTPHMTRFQGQMGGFGVQDVQIQRYEIASVGPLRG